MTGHTIDLSDVTVRYGEIVALDAVTLRVRPGRVCGVIGVNGSGKSTLFKTIVGLVRPESGTVSVGGVSPARARAQRWIGYVPQNEAVDWSFPLSVREVVMTGRYGHMGLTRRPRQADRDAVAVALKRVDMSAQADRQIGRLSGGQRKRAFVARALAQHAGVLLLDEPFAGIDKRSEAMIVHLLRDLAKNDGATILLSTHDLHALTDTVDEAVLLMRKVLLIGSPSDVLLPENLARAFDADVSGSTKDGHRWA